MEKDMTKADRKAKKERKTLEETAAANKAEDLVTLSASAAGGDGDEGGGNSDNDTETNDGRGSQNGKSAKNIAAELARRPPEEVFEQFDTDGSGLIDFEEFRAMLPQVGIKISLPKVSYTWIGCTYTYAPVHMYNGRERRVVCVARCHFSANCLQYSRS